MSGLGRSARLPLAHAPVTSLTRVWLREPCADRTWSWGRTPTICGRSRPLSIAISRWRAPDVVVPTPLLLTPRVAGRASAQAGLQPAVVRQRGVAGLGEAEGNDEKDSIVARGGRTCPPQPRRKVNYEPPAKTRASRVGPYRFVLVRAGRSRNGAAVCRPACCLVLVRVGPWGCVR